MRASDFIAAARALVGTPFQHQGRLPGIGLDCVGVILVAARAAGKDIGDDTAYARRPDTNLLLRHIRENGLKPVGMANLNPGDLIVMAFDANPQHIAIVSEVPENQPPVVIHSAANYRKVVEHSLAAGWRGKVVHAWRFTDLD
jgi:cell wall-associated NlpC family hydrolase